MVDTVHQTLANVRVDSIVCQQMGRVEHRREAAAERHTELCTLFGLGLQLGAGSMERSGPEGDEQTRAEEGAGKSQGGHGRGVGERGLELGEVTQEPGLQGGELHGSRGG